MEPQMTEQQNKQYTDLNKAFCDAYNAIIQEINDWHVDERTGASHYRAQFISSNTEADIQIIRTDSVLEELWLELGDLEDLI